MSTLTAVHITIGRGTCTEGQRPMPDHKWADFIETVKQDLTLTLTIMGVTDFPIETHIGGGSYGGAPEESAKVSTYFEGEMPADFAEALAVCLSATAILFQQESIALAIGPSTLVFAGS